MASFEKPFEPLQQKMLCTKYAELSGQAQKMYHALWAKEMKMKRPRIRSLQRWALFFFLFLYMAFHIQTAVDDKILHDFDSTAALDPEDIPSNDTLPETPNDLIETPNDVIETLNDVIETLNDVIETPKENMPDREHLWSPTPSLEEFVRTTPKYRSSHEQSIIQEMAQVSWIAYYILMMLFSGGWFYIKNQHSESFLITQSDGSIVQIDLTN